MGDDVADVVRMNRVILHDDAHYPTDELDVRGKGPEWAEDAGHAQLWVVEALP